MIHTFVFGATEPNRRSFVAEKWFVDVLSSYLNIFLVPLSLSVGIYFFACLKDFFHVFFQFFNGKSFVFIGMRFFITVTYTQQFHNLWWWLWYSPDFSLWWFSPRLHTSSRFSAAIFLFGGHPKKTEEEAVWGDDENFKHNPLVPESDADKRWLTIEHLLWIGQIW